MPRRSLFPGGVGNTRGDADNFRTLLDDVETKLFGTLPDETWFYPGHGSDSTLGAERPHPPSGVSAAGRPGGATDELARRSALLCAILNTCVCT